MNLCMQHHRKSEIEIFVFLKVDDGKYIFQSKDRLFIYFNAHDVMQPLQMH